MDNNKNKCFCESFSNIPTLPYPSNTIIEYIIQKNFENDKNGKLICKKCGRIITEDEIKERTKKILPIVW